MRRPEDNFWESISFSSVGSSVPRDDTWVIRLGGNLFPPVVINDVLCFTDCLHFCLMSLFLSQDPHPGPIYVWLSYFLRLLLTMTLSWTLVDSLRSVVVCGALCITWEYDLEI